MREIKYLIWGLIILYAQVLLASKLELLEIIPNFLIAYTVFLSINLKFEITAIFVFLLGIAYDLTYPMLLGLNTIGLMLLALGVYKLHPNINKERFIVVTVSVFILNLFYYLIFLIYYLFINQFGWPQITMFFLSSIYNSVISLLVLYLLIISDRIRFHLDV